MARRKKAAAPAAVHPSIAVRATLLYAQDATLEFEWEQVDGWALARIVRKSPQGQSPQEYRDWLLVQGFTPNTRWLAVPDTQGSEQAYVQRDKLLSIRALKPGSLLELVRPGAGHPYLRVTWQAATGRRGWLSLVLDRPTSVEVAVVDPRAGVEARERARSERLQALEAEGVADDDGAELAESEAA